MEGWLIYRKTDAETNKHFIRWFQTEAAHEQVNLRLILRENLTIGISDGEPAIHLNGGVVTRPDFAVVRTIEPLLNQHLESLGISVYNNADTARICNHKGLTHSHVSSLGIPTNDTLFVDPNSGLTEQAPMAYPFVMKEAGGRGGQNVYLVTNTPEWEQLKDICFPDDLIIQSAQHIQLGRDVRVFVVGSTIIGAVLRKSDHDFRANYKLGGSAVWYRLSSQEVAIVSRITASFQFGMVGIDFLLDQNGRFIFNEIEDVVGSRTLSAVSDVNILRHYIQHIKSENP
ncbi:RimK family alpha-L-glutamate ligase [Barrientosiimonas marina]|uniref:RimK family alpha-L-glutamate ligase n=1 Tax=Lentibacillus kimchii TaxID=1542911 RepID=A0ABW2UYA2_9BACI